MNVHTIDLKTAQRFVGKHHRHNKRVAGHLWSLALFDGWTIRGVAVCARPVARHLQNGATIEVRRLATDGTPNACSQLYGASAREAWRRGYRRVVTYTRIDEPGTSLRAAGWRETLKRTRVRQWGCKSRPREHDPDACGRIRWEAPPPKRWPRAESVRHVQLWLEGCA